MDDDTKEATQAKRLAEAQDRIDELEAEVEHLENRLRDCWQVADALSHPEPSHVLLSDIKAAARDGLGIDYGEEPRAEGHATRVELETEVERVVDEVRRSITDLTDLKAFVAPNEFHNIETTRAARRRLQRLLLTLGVPADDIPGSDQDIQDALDRAEDGQDE